VLDLVEPDATAPFDPERPPWSLTVVEGLSPARAAFVLRFHHAVTDGMGGLHVAARLFDRRRHPKKPNKAKKPDKPDKPAEPVELAGAGGPAADRDGDVRTVRPPSPPLAGLAATAGRSLASTAASAARDPLGAVDRSLRLARSLARLVGSAPAGSPLLAGRGIDRHLHVFDVSLPELRAAAKAAGGTVNDALLAAVGGAFRAYHDKHGISAPTMSVTMPIDRRRPGDDPAGNRFAPARFTLPVDEPDTAMRVRIAAAISHAWQDEPALALTDVVAGALNRLPGPVVTRVFGGMLRTIDVDVVDLPGLVERAYLGGARIERMWAFAPPTGAAFSVTLLSHADAACVAVVCDRAAVLDPELLTGYVEAGLDEVVALAHEPRADRDREAVR
jgi:WS/DGAT/MGAT family acyltransferase